MGKRILGLDLGTNSIGWAVVDNVGGGQFDLVKKGVHIFQEGVKIEKGNESSKAAERTGHRSARRLKFRRKLRKIRTLKALSEFGYCPTLTVEELKAWQSRKVYPENQEFREWCRTVDPADKNGVFENPYYYRWLAATTELDLSNEEDCFKLGRAFYHMAQRRGFKSNRLDSTPEKETGVVKTEIAELSQKMNGRTLGQYFWEDCYRDGMPIRKVHTSRDEHYLAEFNAICEKQQIPNELREQLLKSIFFQRPLKSQKGLVANCPFEPKKKRCPDSHPWFEEFRMWQVLNNIKMKAVDDERLRPLTEEEKRKIIPKFLRTKPRFDFKELAKELTPKKQKFAYYKARNTDGAHVLFNYRDDQTIAGCPVSARFKNLFGDDYKATMLEAYCGVRVTKDGVAKGAGDILHEAWHVLFSFDDDEKVKQFARDKFGLDGAGQASFAKIKPGQGYGALSLKAIRKILPFLEQGLIYSHAVFFANLDQVVSIPEDDLARVKEEIKDLVDHHRQHLAKVQFINGLVKEYRNDPRAFEQTYDLRKPHELELPAQLAAEAERICSEIARLIKANNDNGEFLSAKRLDERVCDYLQDAYGNIDATKLYHPSKEETYEPAERAEDGKLYLGSPQISSIRNPVFMRTMHRLKALTNELIKQGVINEQTQIHVEMARELNDANKRAAIRTWQRKNETDRKKYKEAIEESLSGQGIERVAGEDEILKYQLWEEQDRQCPYCGGKINIGQLLGDETEIEHTIPRSLCCDNSLENKTVSHRVCNRDKGNCIPADCPGHEDILQRVDHWAKRVEKLTKDIDKLRGTSGMEKEAKDRKIQKRLVLMHERNYFREKYRRFIMTEVTGGFKNSQLVDTRIITKYARLYMKTVFNTVHTVNGNITGDFRHYWGVEKSRDNHVHHTIDAIVVACITRDQYQALAEAYHMDEVSHSRIHIGEPWPHFASDMAALKNQVLVSHYAPNHLLKQTRKKAREKGRIIPKIVGGRKVLDEKGQVVPKYFEQGKTARGSLHKDTFYGQINNHGSMSYVVRVPLVHNPGGGVFGFDAKAYDKKDELYDERQGWKTKDLERIVDPVVRDLVVRTVQRRIDSGAAFKDALVEPIWLNEDKGVAVKRVRCVAKPKGVFPLKGQRDVAPRKSAEWKRNLYVENDENYLIAFYEGEAPNGRMLRGFKALNNYTASTDGGERGYPDAINIRNVDCRLRQVLKIGDTVLLYGESPDELKTMVPKEIFCRLYEAFGINGLDGRVQFRHHMEARNDKDQDKATANFELDQPVSKIKVSPSNMKVLVEGVDFHLNVLGEIKFTEGNPC